MIVYDNPICRMEVFMKSYKQMTKEELLTLKAELEKQFEDAKGKGLSLDMSRGKPAATQLDISMDMLDTVNSTSAMKDESGVDCRNYVGPKRIRTAVDGFADR